MAALTTKFRPDQLAMLANHSPLTALTQMAAIPMRMCVVKCLLVDWR